MRVTPSSRTMIRLSMSVAAGVTVAAVASTTAQAAPASPEARFSYAVFQAANNDASTHAKLCLDADANAGVGALVSTVTCNGSKYQQWTPGSAGSHIIWMNGGHPGLVLAASSSSTGASIVLKKASSTDITQWFEYFGTESGGFRIGNPSTNYVLDAVYAGGVARNGRHVQLNRPADVSNQRWYQSVH